MTKTTKTKKKRKPKMRLWLVRDEDQDGGELWLVKSTKLPILTLDNRAGWHPYWLPGKEGYRVYAPGFFEFMGSDLAPGECVELREVR